MRRNATPQRARRQYLRFLKRRDGKIAPMLMLGKYMAGALVPMAIALVSHFAV